MTDVGLQWSQTVVAGVVHVLDRLELLVRVHEQDLFEALLELAFKLVDQEVLEQQNLLNNL